MLGEKRGGMESDSRYSTSGVGFVRNTPLASTATGRSDVVAVWLAQIAMCRFASLNGAIDDAGRCGIYETRPRGCRDFDCSREPGYLRTHPLVAALLSIHGVPLAATPPER